MEREDSTPELVELGAASVETQGLTGLTTDQQIGLKVAGISEE
jgi:hypothetical protein